MQSFAYIKGGKRKRKVSGYKHNLSHYPSRSKALFARAATAAFNYLTQPITIKMIRADIVRRLLLLSERNDNKFCLWGGEVVLVEI